MGPAWHPWARVRLTPEDHKGTKDIPGGISAASWAYIPRWPEGSWRDLSIIPGHMCQDGPRDHGVTSGHSQWDLGSILRHMCQAGPRGPQDRLRAFLEGSWQHNVC